MNPSAPQLVTGLRNTLSSILPDYEEVIVEFGQVAACERREKGIHFSLSDHISGLVKALLSNQRPWKPIQDNMSSIEDIFLQFDAEALKSAKPHDLEKKLLSLKCGNRSLRKQMESLRHNIEVLEKISRGYGSVDEYLNAVSLDEFVNSVVVGPYKLKQVGIALAYEYLRHVGVRVAKPDTHIRRIMGSTRLGYINHPFPSEEDVVKCINEISSEAGVNPSYLDTLLWLFCAVGYGNICGSTTNCSVCQLQHSCNKIA